jgi:hypothetical protein
VLVEAVIIQFRPVKVLHRNVTALLHRNVTALIEALKVLVEAA